MSLVSIVTVLLHASAMSSAQAPCPQWDAWVHSPDTVRFSSDERSLLELVRNHQGCDEFSRALAKTEAGHARSRFWTRWLAENRRRYSTAEIEALHTALTYGVSMDDPAPLDSAAFLRYVEGCDKRAKEDSLERREDSIRAAQEGVARRRFIAKMRDSILKEASLEKTRSRGYRFWGIPRIVQAKGIRIDMGFLDWDAAEEAAAFLVVRLPRGAIAGGDARILLVLEDGSVVELEAVTDYQGRSAFLTRAFAQSEFPAMVASIRIDGGAQGGHGVDFEVPGAQRARLGMYLSKAKWIQEIVSTAL